MGSSGIGSGRFGAGGAGGITAGSGGTGRRRAEEREASNNGLATVYDPRDKYRIAEAAGLRVRRSFNEGWFIVGHVTMYELVNKSSKYVHSHVTNDRGDGSKTKTAVLSPGQAVSRRRG
jgi:hypothetical protein